MAKEMKVFVSNNTEKACWKPSDGKRIVVTALKIENQEEKPICIRIDIGDRTRFVAYLDRTKKKIGEIQIRLPVPLSGKANEPLSVHTFEPLPISVALAGYEV